MAPARLSPLDASFLEVESPTAHMHVGWAATFAPPEGARRPSFEDLRDHIARRLCRAPRYRQRLAQVPLGIDTPVLVDDSDFDVVRHVRRSDASTLGEVTDAVMSAPLDHSLPLWELWIADRLEDGRIGVVGKVHHCLVDGVAAVELAAMLLDPEPDPEPIEPDGWRPAPTPDALTLAAGGVRDRASRQLGLMRAPVAAVSKPKRLFGFAEDARRAASALADSFGSPAPESPLNEPISSDRHVATVARPLGQLRDVSRRFATKLNDVLLAVSAGGMRRFLERRDEEPIPLRTMVPVNVRDGDGDDLGNHISFIFVDLPCQEPDPLVRLMRVYVDTSRRKLGGVPRGADSVLKTVGYAPRVVQQAAAHLAASPRTYNLVVSNIPGPPETMYMLGCRLEQAFPIVPLADRHALSIGMTTVAGTACFGLYADRETLPDADLLARDVEDSIDELLELSA